MTCSTEPVRSALARLRQRLTAENLAHEVDDPIEQAAQRFSSPPSGPLSRAQFHHLITGYVRHLYEHGLRLPRLLTEAEALAEALALIAEAYPARPTDRYDAAFVDATASDAEGPERVLLLLAEALKRRERGAYVAWLILTSFDATDWRARCALLDSLRGEAPHLFSAELAHTATPQLADHLLTLLGCELELDSRDSEALAWLGG
jgi:hypothetical protein